MKDTGVRAIRQGRSGSQKPTLPVRQGGMREYGDYDLSPLPLEPADRAQRRRPVQPMSDTVRGSRPDTRRGVPVQSGHLRANPTPRKSVRLHPVRRHNINWMLIGLIVVVLGLGAFIGYEVYMARSDSGQRSTARKNVLSTFEPQLELAVSKDATRTTEKEDLLKQWNSATAQSYWEVAQEFADGGDLETAITAYRMADILDPDNYDGLLDMASTYEMMNQNDKAEELYLNLIENGYEAAAQRGEYHVRIPAYLNEVTAQPRQIFDQNEVNQTMPRILKHFQEAGSLKVSPAITVVTITPDFCPSVEPRKL